MQKGFLFSIDEKYHVEAKKVDCFKPENVSAFEYFISESDVLQNEDGFFKDAEHILIARMRRKKVVEDLERLGFQPGCKPPEYAYYVVYGQPNVRNTPPSLYYEIEQTFEDMGWEYTGCPHHQD